MNTATGGFTVSTNDLSSPSIGLPLSINRSYSSDDPTVGPMGVGWTHTYAAGLTALGNGDVRFRSGTGQQLVFEHNANGSFTAPVGVTSSLTSHAGGYELVTRAGRTYSFDSSGRLMQIVDRSGHEQTLAYDGSGRLLTVTDEEARAYTFTYAGSLLSRVTAPDGRHVDYGYTSGHLTSFTDARGKTTAYSNDAAGRLQGVTDPLGHEVAHNVYGDDGRITAQTDALGKTSTFSYEDSPIGVVTTMTDARGKVWKDTYNYNVLVKREDPNGHVTSFDWSDGLQPASVPRVGESPWTLQWDASGNLVSKTASAPFGYTETFAYNAQNKPTSHTDANGNVTTFAYDGDGDLSEVHEPGGATTTITRDPDTALPTSVTDARGKIWRYGCNHAGQLTETTSPLGLRTTMTYDDRGFMTSRTDPRGQLEGIDPDDYTTKYTYDDAGHLLTTTDPLGGVTTNVYDDAGRLASTTDARSKQTQYLYDEAGELVKTTAPDGGETTYVYDDSGHLLSRTDAEGGTTSYSYDDAGRQITKTDARGKIWTYGYDAAGDRTSETSPLGHETTRSFDILGRLAASTDPRGNEGDTDPNDFTTTYGYDGMGNLTSSTDPLGHSTSSTYDHAGRVLTATDAAGKTTTTTYDATGHQLTSVDPLGETTTNAYDDDGRLGSVTDPRSKTTSYERDAAGNVLATISPLGHRTSMEYDALNRLTAKVDPRGNEPGADPADFTAQFAFDPVGNVLVEMDALGHATTYGYDDLGNRSTKDDADAHETLYSNDHLGRLEALTAPDGATTSYGYDAAGNMLTRTDDNGHTTTYGYDDDGRRVSETTPLGSTRSFAFDAAGNPTTEVDPRGNATATPDDFTIDRSFDAAGHLSSIDYSDATPDVGYSYDARGLRTAMTDGSGTETRSYDDAGRLLSVARGSDSVSYGYDAASNITSRTYPDSTVVASAYDGDGRLASVTDPSGIASYTRDADGRSATLSRPNGTATAWTYDRVGRPSTIVHDKGGVPFASYGYTYDAVGNPTHVTAPEGAIDYGYDQQDRLTDACYDPTCSTQFLHYTYDGVGNRLTERRSRSAAVSRRGVQTATTLSTARTSLKILKPLGTLAGDVMLLHVASVDGGLVKATPVGGWTPVLDGSALHVHGSLFYRTATAADMTAASYTVNFSVPVQAGGAIASYAGVDGASPIEDAKPKSSLAVNNTFSLLPVAQSARGELVGMFALNSAASGVSGLTSRWQASTIAPPAAGGGITSFGADGSVATSGTSGTPTATSNTQAAWVGMLVSLRPGTGTTTYAYNADDELTSSADPVRSTGYGYDAAGNTTIAGSRTMSYDLAGRMSQVADPASTTAYAYDGDGKRVSAIQASSTTNFTWDPSEGLPELVAETNASGSLVRRYEYGDGLLSETTPAATSWYHGDALGSVGSITDGLGSQDWSYGYEPFGASRVTSQLDAGAAMQPMRFGRQYLDSTSLYHLRARSLDPVLGLLLARDPLPNPSGAYVSPYAYANARPGVLGDPSGLRPEPFWGLVVTGTTVIEEEVPVEVTLLVETGEIAPVLTLCEAGPEGCIAAVGYVAGIYIYNHRQELEDVGGDIYDAITGRDDWNRETIYRETNEKRPRPSDFRYDPVGPAGPGVSFFVRETLPGVKRLKFGIEIATGKDPSTPGATALVVGLAECAAIHDASPPGHWTVRCAGGRDGTRSALSQYAKSHPEAITPNEAYLGD